MATAALVVGYTVYGVIALTVIVVLVALFVVWLDDLRADWRSWRRHDSVVVALYPESTNVRVLPRGEAS